MIINHNITAINTNRQFNIVNKDLTKSAEKLSSGYKINKAADDAAGLSISEKMRKQIRGLSRASENCEDGVSMLQTADGALNEVHDMLHRMNELLVKAANGTNSKSDRDTINDELSQLTTELDRVFDTTRFNETYLFKDPESVRKPIISDNVLTSTSYTSTVSYASTTVIWLPKGTTPNTGTAADNYRSETDLDTKTVNTIVHSDELNVDTEHLEMIRRQGVTETTEIFKRKEVTTYIDKSNDADYTSLRQPAIMTGNNGYINVQTDHNSLPLSCAMSQLGVKVDDQLKSYSLYYDNNVTPTTVSSNNGDTATTSYDLGDGVILRQEITRVQSGTNGASYDTYVITYSAEYNGTDPSKKIDVRLAFDTMNTQATSVKDGTTKDFTLESDDAKIDISATGADNAVLGDIGELYGVWDDSKVTHGDNIPSHTGVGAWWSKDVAAGSTVTLGSLSYKLTELKKMPWEKKVQTIGEKTTIIEGIDRLITHNLKGRNCNIQAGAETAEFVYITLPNLSTELLGIDFGRGIDAHKAEEGIENMGNALTLISAVRSYMGALTNRLVHAESVDDITVENTTASESRIRDTNMALEMVKYSKNNILSQAGQSMLTQANQINQGVLQLVS